MVEQRYVKGEKLTDWAKLEFIKNHFDRGHGGIRGEKVMFLYRRALEAQTAEQLHSLAHAVEQYVAGYRFDEDVNTGCAWCGSKFRDVIYVGFGYHRIVAENVFFTSEQQMERRYAKVTKTTKSVEEALEYVDKEFKTKSMIRNVEEVLYGE